MRNFHVLIVILKDSRGFDLVISSWDPEELTDFDGMSITETSGQGDQHEPSMLHQDDEADVFGSAAEAQTTEEVNQDESLQPLQDSDEHGYGNNGDVERIPNTEVMSSQGAEGGSRGIQGLKYLQEVVEKALRANDEALRSEVDETQENEPGESEWFEFLQLGK